MIDHLPLATNSWDEKEYEALQRVIRSGMFSMGAEVHAFEQEFAAVLNAKYCLMVNSGSSANLLAVAGLFYLKENPLQAGDEVIVPAVSWSTTYFPLHQYGLKVRFVDIDKDTFNLDLAKLESALSDRTRLVFGVNLLGNTIDYSKLENILRGRNIYLLEDNCESLGAEFQGRQAGTFGLAGTFSSFFSHHISTMEGGVVATDSEQLYQIMFSLRSHGWTRNLPKENWVCSKSDDEFEESFRFVLPGYNLRPLEMSGALGREQLRKLPSIVEGRRKNAEIFQERFSDHPLVSIQKETGKSSWFGFAMVLKEGVASRGEILRCLADHKVETRPIVAGNFTRNPAVKFFDYAIHEELTCADLLHDRGFFIGNHHFDISSQLGLVDKVIRSVT